MNMLRHVWRKRLGIPFERQPAQYQIEWNKECISELLPACRKHNTCLFTNIASFYRDELKETIETLKDQPQTAVEILCPLIAANKAMKLTAHCVTHNRECSIVPCGRHIAGTSCKPWSRKGAGLGAQDREILFTLAWLGLRVAVEDTEVLSENVLTQVHGHASSSRAAALTSDEPCAVPDAGLGNLLIRLLSPMYHMEKVALSPYMIGAPFNREREFVKMVHKKKAAGVVSPLSRFCKRFFRCCQWSWRSAKSKCEFMFFLFVVCHCHYHYQLLLLF